MVGVTMRARLASQIAVAFLVSGTAVKAQDAPAPTAASTGFDASRTEPAGRADGGDRVQR
jgi:hypothetical protein